MALTVGAIAAKDGSSTTIAGGMLAADTVGGGAGPWFLYQGLVDGVAGSNKAQIDSSNRLAVLASLAAGTNAIGKLSANSGVDIGDVDVTSAVITGGSVAHDGAASAVNPILVGGFASAAAPADVSADTDSVRAWRLRNGAAATVLTAAGALIGGDATNGLDVDVTRMSALVTGSAIIGRVGIDQTTPGTTNLVALTAETTKAIGVVRNSDGAGNLLTSATRGSERALSTQIVDASGNQITSFGNGTQYTEDVAAATDPIGNMLMAVRRDTLSTSEVSADGDNIALKATSKGELHTRNTSLETLLGEVQTTPTSNTVLDRLKAIVTAVTAGTITTVAHDAADSGDPIKMGGYAKAAPPTDVSADGDRVNAWYLRNGAQASVLTAAGALIGGDATNGLDVDVTRVQGTVTVGGTTIVQSASGTITRPADTTAYASGDLVANSVTAGSVTALQFSTLARISGGSGVIVGARIQKSTAGITNAAFRVHYFDTVPTFTSAGDNSALSTVVVASAKGYLGYVDIPAMVGFSDVAWGTGAPDNSRGSIPFKASAQIIYAIVEARGAYTPGSAEVFTIATFALQD